MFDSAKYQKTWADIKQFASTKFDLFKVGFLEKAAKIVGLILFALVVILLLFAVISFGCLALIYAIGQALPMWASALIVVALWLLLMIGVVVFRDQLFINPMLAAISSILFEQTENNQPADSMTITPAEKEVRNE
ncbi:MAG: phage holin family protein [Paludibacteraceae bacterium]|nr:phage holin family protein [Paludibacteraceae bacterium]MBO7455884.1 phage holin family protein [Paludibacteraceae bacterium]